MTIDKRNQRSYKNYLINRHFQLKWTAIILLVALGVFITFGAYVYQTEQHNSQKIVEGLNNMGYAEAEIELMEELFDDDDSGILWLLLGLGVGLVFTLAGVGVLLTHRVAGPVFALGCFIDQVRKGNYRFVRGFRKGDEFQEVADGFQAMVASLREKEESEINQLDELQSVSGMPQEAVDKIAELISRKRECLE